jgi:hypothetical protein
VTKNKKEYYKLLSKAKISFSASTQETFGIGTVEAMMLGCIPLVPRRLSYVELYNGLFQYSTLSAARHKIKNFMKDYDNVLYKKILQQNQKKIAGVSQQTFKIMSDVMLSK